MTPTVSVVIAAYNAGDFIEASLSSALSQSLEDLEVVVVDDGSTDQTARIASSTGDSRVTVIRQSNAGQSAALNRGVAVSRGTYIKFLDADDVLNRGHLASQLSALRNFPDCVASCRWGYFALDAAMPKVRNEHTNRDYDDPMEWLLDSMMLDEGMMGGWMWLIPRQVWDRSGGWNESLTLNNDFDFSVRLLLASAGVRFAPEAVYSYRKGVGGALSGSASIAAMRSAFETTRSGCEFLLARSNSERSRRACADRWQWWLYHFYPDHAELAQYAEREVQRLGGSSKPLEGGRVLRFLLPIIGWKAVRRLQARAHRSAWSTVLRWKEQRRVSLIDD
jgi:glycosyltransferase involved in cell wall biosynthesis